MAQTNPVRNVALLLPPVTTPPKLPALLAIRNNMQHFCNPILPAYGETLAHGKVQGYGLFEYDIAHLETSTMKA
jgi:hypothetical protein